MMHSWVAVLWAAILYCTTSANSFEKISNGRSIALLNSSSGPHSAHARPTILNNTFSRGNPTTSILSSDRQTISSTTLQNENHHNTSSTKAHLSKFRNPTISTVPHAIPTTTSIHSNPQISTSKPTRKIQPNSTTSSCIPYTPGHVLTVWTVVPNTNTITITLYPNQTTTFTTQSQWTPPVTCSPHSRTPDTTSGESSTFINIGPPLTSTIIITSKNPVTIFTTQSSPAFPGGRIPQKLSVPGSSSTSSSEIWPTIHPPSSPTGIPGPGTGNSAPTLGVSNFPTTVNVGGVNVVVGPSSVAIGTVTFVPGSGSGSMGGSDSDNLGGLWDSIITQGGETFTVNPSRVIGPGTAISIPTAASTSGGDFIEGLTTTVIDGVSVAAGNDMAVVGGRTYSIGDGSPEQTIIVNKETISIGVGGVGFVGTTITPAAALPTNVLVFDAEPFSVIGASVAVFDGSTFTFTGGPPRTTVFNGDTITAGPSGFIDGSSTFGGPSHPAGTQFGIAGGMIISEIGSSVADIDGTTLIIGPDASRTTATIEGYTVIADPSGLNIGGASGKSTTLDFPFNPTIQEVTAGGITFSEIGGSLVNVDGRTFTIGSGAAPTTDVYNGQTISIGPGGIGFATTTIISFTTPPPSATITEEMKSRGAALRPHFSILGACIALGVGILI